ncbi:MAG: PhoH family protein [Bacilli bacterium]
MVEFKYFFNFNSAEKEELFSSNNNMISKFLAFEYNINIKGRVPNVTVVSDINEKKTIHFLNKITDLINRDIDVKTSSIAILYDSLENDSNSYRNYGIISDYKGNKIRTKSNNQHKYIKNIENNDLVFGVGPAGTGKTFLAVCMAVKMLKNNDIEKIIIARPAVEAGESLGFLPGDLKDKVDPFLQPIYDGLNLLLSTNVVERYIERKIIEIAPIAYMRGRTLNNAFIILDEAQNTTKEQMKMFLTRLGVDSKMVITGDDSQIDLKNKFDSGLLHSINILSNIKGISIIKLDTIDVMRHYLVRKIIKAYNKEI